MEDQLKSNHERDIAMTRHDQIEANRGQDIEISINQPMRGNSQIRLQVNRESLSAGQHDLTNSEGIGLYGIEFGSAECRIWSEQQSNIGTLSRGALFTIPRGQSYKIEVDRPCQAILVRLIKQNDSDVFPEWLGTHGVVFRDPLLFETVLRIYQEQGGDKPTSDQLIGAAASMLMTTLEIIDQRSENIRQRTHSKPKMSLRNCMEWIDDNISEKINIRHLADIAGMTEWNFFSLFKSKYQISPHRYILDCRLAKAKAMLQDTDNAIAQIAYECGFSSQSHLTTSFKQHFDETPGQYRKRVNINEDSASKSDTSERWPHQHDDGHILHRLEN